MDIKESIKMLVANPELISLNSTSEIQRKDVYEAINSDITLLDLRIEDLDRVQKERNWDVENEASKAIRSECLAKIDALVNFFQAIEKI